MIEELLDDEKDANVHDSVQTQPVYLYVNLNNRCI